MGRMEVITRVERRRRYSDEERAAVLAQQPLGFTYSRPGAEPRRRSVAPCGVMFGRANYLVAGEGESEEPRKWRLDRMSEIAVLDRVAHPPESYGLRIEDTSGAVLAYSGDTGICDAVVELARDADVFLCEASWTHMPGHRPPDLHLSGTEAGQIAARAGVKELLLTHIPPWTSREDVIAEAKSAFDGPVRAVVAGETIEL